jgi:hypothetical protein
MQVLILHLQIEHKKKKKERKKELVEGQKELKEIATS